MPSGFQQDTNQLQQHFYRVVLTMGAGTALWPTADGLTNGAVNPYNWDAFATPPSTATSSSQLARGNMRWQAIIEELCLLADAQMLDVSVTSANNSLGDSQPTALAFTVRYDRDEFVLSGYQKILLAENPANTTYVGVAGGANTVTTTALAIKDLVARGITRGDTTGYTRSVRVYDPVNEAGTQVPVTIEEPDVIANIWRDVAVTEIVGTTLV